jgi:hypothetical protein
MKLGRIQKEVFRCLEEHKKWSDRGLASGWVWDTPLRTKRILDSLCKKGLVVCKDGIYKIKENQNNITEKDSGYR